MNNNDKVKKRFISGASCPECQAEDELVIYVDQGRDVYECLACGHTKKRPTVEEQQADKDRVSTIASDALEIKAQPIVLKPKKPT